MAHAFSLTARLRPWALLLTVLMGSQGLARAGLLEDDEARRAILALRQQRTQDAEALATLSTQVDQLKRSLLDMAAQVEQLRSEAAKQRGGQEVLARDLSDAQRRINEVNTSVDERVRKLEPQTVTVDGKTFMVDVDEKRDFDAALGRLRGEDFAGAATSLNALLKRSPGTGYKESIQYWLGNAYYGLRQYKDAIASFKSLVEQSPDHARAPEALLSIASCQSELKDNEGARRTLESLIKRYPKAEAATAANDRLQSLSSKPRKGAK